MSIATLASRPTEIRHPFRRALIAGCAWGLPMAALLIAMSALACGGICLTDAALTTAISLGTGIVAIGPLVAFPRPPRA
jgi:hypothetical protein